MFVLNFGEIVLDLTLMLLCVHALKDQFILISRFRVQGRISADWQLQIIDAYMTPFYTLGLYGLGFSVENI
jgi:hypothetical protein